MKEEVRYLKKIILKLIKILRVTEIPINYLILFFIF
jgi:hypothetical protein